MHQHAFIAFAIPLFLFFMGLEYVYTKRKGKNFFQFAESIANINVGIAERLLDVFTILPFFYFFQYIHLHYAFFDLTAGPVTWLLLFLLTDLVWYWYHRLAHEINLLWAAHIVHHQSEDFNYTVSARITVFQASIRCLFWTILPLIGFPAEMISIFLLIHGLYPFFIHTQAIGKLGWLEYFMVTPSHHRVHHSSNPEYLDKNYGDVLIIWDKIFGTFVAEKEKPVYGLTKPLQSHSFLWQHFHYPLELLIAIKRTRGFKARLTILFGKPDLIDPRFRYILEKKFLKKKSFLLPTYTHKVYVIVQTILSLVVLFCTILFYTHLSFISLVLLSAFIFISLVNTGAILEQRSWIFYFEFTRLIIPLLWIWIFYPYIATSICIISTLLLLLYFFRPMEKRYHRLLYQQKPIVSTINYWH